MSKLQKRLEQLERQRAAQRTRPAAVFLHGKREWRGWDADDAIDIIIHAGADEPNLDEWELLCVDDGVPIYVRTERAMNAKTVTPRIQNQRETTK